jgi:Flp pilus assembly protein TadG
VNLFRSRRAAPAASARRRSRGQVIVIFAGAMLAFMGLMAIVIDVSWYWANTLRVQRAADAAALAGVVWLPNLYSSADTTARAEATKNGYTQGGITNITTQKDPQNDRKLIVTISTSTPSFFARVIGLASFPITRTSKAEFILPVAMGSPENYYGVFGDIRDATFTGTTTTDTGFKAPANNAASGKCSPNCNWASNGTVINKTVHDTTTFTTSPATNLAQQAWGQFDFSAIPNGATINGIEVQMWAKEGGSGNGTTCSIGVQLSPNGGGNWYPAGSTTAITTPALSTTDTLYTLGTTSSQAPWLNNTWDSSDFSSNIGTGFLVRLTMNQPNASCSNTRTAMVDTLNIRVTYTATTTTPAANKQLKGPGTGCLNGVSDCKNPDGAVLNYRGFWATMNTEGAANINGDAFQPYYDVPTSTAAPACPTAQLRACYDNINYYNYAIDMAAGSTNGLVYIFDPQFCATLLQSGTGDRWFGSATGMSSWYELYNTNNTPYNLLDDTLITTSGGKFTNINGSDTTMGGPSGQAECMQKSTAYGDGRDYHDSWYVLNPGAPLSGGGSGTVYRLHTTGTDPANASAQRNANGEQTFAIYANASGTLPEVYGLGAMQMFSPLELPAPVPYSEFYIAQVPQAHAGKTLELSLWDPGDTGALSANLQIEIPTAVGWSPVSMTWTSLTGTSGSPQNCTGYTQNQTGNSIVTNAGGGSTGVYNGCWLTIDVTIPANYTAPQSGWWKIRYNMAGSGTSSDVTTWTAKIRGNPVHLVLP